MQGHYITDHITSVDHLNQAFESIFNGSRFDCQPFEGGFSSLGKGIGVWVPNEKGEDVNIVNFGSKVDFNATTFGIGMTPTIGIGGGFLALDMNIAWSDVPQLKKPAQTFVFAPRFGKSFKLNKPEQNIAVWVGAFRVKLNSETNGSINLEDVIPLDGSFQGKIDQAEQKITSTQNQVDAWWAGLTPQQQNNPINQAKYNAANAALTKAGNFVAAIETAAGNVASSSVQYSMDKRVKDPWNFIVGAQYQINKHFMLRAETGFLGSRTQVMAGLQYRFGL